jgi:aryl-alcohol dehydrogenase-like predicted oxidoreductase
MALPGQRHRNNRPDEKESKCDQENRGLTAAGDARLAAGQGTVVIPIPGASRPESIIDSAQAPELALSRDELARLDAD